MAACCQGALPGTTVRQQLSVEDECYCLCEDVWGADGGIAQASREVVRRLSAGRDEVSVMRWPWWRGRDARSHAGRRPLFVGIG